MGRLAGEAVGEGRENCGDIQWVWVGTFRRHGDMSMTGDPRESSSWYVTS